ncbi:MAG: universal stress protein [Candidatus Rokuibacteriota bacterium]
MARLRRILHPSDFSRASNAAFARAVAMARADRAELVVVNVLSHVMPFAGEGFSPKAYADLDASLRAAAMRSLDRLLGRARRAGVRTRGLVLDGAPHDRIVRAARSPRCDLIVMGTHGRDGLARLFLGSVAERVVATAPCPVMTVRSR